MFERFLKSVLARARSALAGRLRRSHRAGDAESGIVAVDLAGMRGGERGAAGERVAAAWLKDRGYEIVERNYRCRVGELDLIARHGDGFVFVEVKTRSTARYGRPAEAVGARTRARMCAAANRYLLRSGSSSRPGPRGYGCRFDVVEVLGVPGGRVEVTHIRDAFRPGWV